MDFPFFLLAQLAAYDGSFGIRDTDDHTDLTLQSFLVTEDTDFAEFEVDGASAVTEFGVGAGHKAGDLIVVGHGRLITRIQLTSGGGRGYNKIVSVTGP